MTLTPAWVIVERGKGAATGYKGYRRPSSTTRRRNAGNTAVPSDDEVKNFLSGIGQTPPFVYLCRCGTHMRIIRAIQQASQEMYHDD